jgi:hypothetical protein
MITYIQDRVHRSQPQRESVWTSRPPTRFRSTPTATEIKDTKHHHTCQQEDQKDHII